MRGIPWGFTVHHPGRALAIRGRAMRTFGSLVLFAALILLGVGAYILQEEFANPITAQSMGLLAAAFVMAVAMILLYYRVKTRVGGTCVRQKLIFGYVRWRLPDG